MTVFIPSRRGFLTGLAAALAAPAIVRVSSLMPVKALVPVTGNRNALLTIDMITREAVRLLTGPNQFLMDLAFYDGEQWNDTLRTRLPNDYNRRINHLPVYTA